MTFRKKTILLSAAAGALFLVYALSFVFSGENRARRGALWTPLDKNAAKNAAAVEISSKEAAVRLENQNGVWKVARDEMTYPARQKRIESLFEELCKSGEYPVRSSQESSYEKFGLSAESAAGKITVKDGGGVTAELYFGDTDSTGKEIYIRAGSGGPVRSGADVFSSFFTGAEKDWFDLRLFPGREEAGLNADSVQRIVVRLPPGEDGSAAAAYTLLRGEKSWSFEDGGEALSATVLSFLNYLLDASAEDFISEKELLGAPFSGELGSVTLERGAEAAGSRYGERINLILGPKIGEKTPARVSGSEAAFILGDWTLEQVFRTKESLSAAK
jgi:hypothetical protein